MRKSKHEAAQSRQRIVDAASLEFRRKGIGETGLADLMGAAGMTHGGFYKHFDSKDQVVDESVRLAIDTIIDTIESTLSTLSGKKAYNTVISEYLSIEHRDDAANGCPFVGLGIELARNSDAVRGTTTTGFLRLVEVIAASYEGLTPSAAKKEALVTLSTLIGAATMARVVNDETLSAAILQQARIRLTR